MKVMNINKINLEKLSNQLRRYEKQWIAISATNDIVAHGNTYGETLNRAKKKGTQETILFKVPPLNYSLSP